MLQILIYINNIKDSLQSSLQLIKLYSLKKIYYNINYLVYTKPTHNKQRNQSN